MKTIVVTQRVDIIKEYGERRDALDQRWLEYLLSVGLWPVSIPNNLSYVKQYLSENSIDGILLTGGNSLTNYGGESPERDVVELLLLERAIKGNIPLLGVCRGMQVVQHYYGTPLLEIKGHVGTRHGLQVESGFRLSGLIGSNRRVNAYHNLGSYADNAEDYDVVARSMDGVVMAIEHKTRPIYGIMWHSERERPFQDEDLHLFREIFCR